MATERCGVSIPARLLDDPDSRSALCTGILLVRDDQSLPNRTLSFMSSIRGLPSRFRRYLVAAGIFGFGDFSHALLILAATQVLTPAYGVVRAAQIAGALYVLRNVVQAFSSYPIGAAADRYGHHSVLLAGYMLGVATAISAALLFATGSTSLMQLSVVFVIAGLYVAVQEAIEPSLTAEFVSGESRSVSFGLLGAVNGFGKLISSTGVGLLWTAVSPIVAFSTAAVLMLLGTAALAFATITNR